jgi:PleD family two-component response regulator
LRLPHENNGNWGIVTISIGAVCASPANGPINVLFRQADTLLYRAKEGGRNRAEFD